MLRRESMAGNDREPIGRKGKPARPAKQKVSRRRLRDEDYDDDYDDDYEDDGQFILYVYHGEYFVLDQTLAIKLPNYVKDELIATIQGHW